MLGSISGGLAFSLWEIFKEMETRSGREEGYRTSIEGENMKQVVGGKEDWEKTQFIFATSHTANINST